MGWMMQMADSVLQPAVVSHTIDQWCPEMWPVLIDGCFGWLHVPAAAVSAKTAVLLCPALGDEGLTAHSHFRRLAQSLAQAGYPTLRFDYPGTGDSCEVDPASERWGIWRKSVDTAANWLRNVTGAERLVLCGLRLGALLAAEAAHARADIAALVLLAPVLRGRTFIRQLEVEAKLAGKRPSEALLLDGSPLSQTSIQALTGAELIRAQPPQGCATMIFTPSPSPALVQCSEEWRRRGVSVDQAAFAGLEPLLRSRIMTHEQPADPARVTEWLGGTAPACSGGSLQMPLPAPLMHQNWRETPLRFGPQRALFGMLCQPRDEVGSQVVVIVNSGGDPHAGAERSGTMMARQLAASGIASLRMDFAGIGDSIAPGDGPTHVFDTDRRPDVSVAFDALAELGYSCLALSGVCSGAYHAFRAAAADERVATLLLVNLPTLDWQAGADIASFRLYDVSIGMRARRAWSIKVWWRLLKGELHIQHQILALGGKAAKRVLGRFSKARPAVQAASAARTAMMAISRRTRTLILMSPNELGLMAMAQEFGPNWKLPGVALHVLPSIDHAVTDPVMRSQLTSMMIDFLSAGYGGRSTKVR